MTCSAATSACTRFAFSGRLLFTVGLFLIFSASTRAGITAADEYEIRAAMLVNLTRFINGPGWAIDPTHPELLICILGSDSIGPIAERYAQNVSIEGRPMRVRRLNTIDLAASCNLLYVGAGQQKRVDPVVDELARKGVLTISESPNAITPHQVIGLPRLDDHIQIQVNLVAAERTGLSISSKLLRLAAVSQ